MKKILLSVGVLLTLTSGLAMAGTIDLQWNSCFTHLAPAPLPSATKPNVCTSNSGAQNLIATFYPSAEVTNLDAMDAFIDYHLTTGVPCWWNFTGSLRATALSITLSDPFTCGSTLDQTCFGCPGNYWTTVANGTGGGGMALIDPNFGRISCTFGVPQGTGTAPSIGQEEFGFGIRITNANTLTCAGCSTPITLTFDHIILYGGALAQGDGVNSVQSVTYNQAQHSAQAYYNLNPTPTEKKTWGAIKAIYRQ